jgi:Flp pilus assembly protein TadB
MRSERVVIESPLSFTGSRKRLWKLASIGRGTAWGPWLKWLLLAWVAVFLIGLAWLFVAGWYLLFGLLLMPWRLLRRSSRKQKRDRLRHREILEAIDRQKD